MLLRYFLAVVVLFSPPVRGDCSEVLLQAIWNNCTETNNTNATNTGSADGACDVNASLRVNETLQCLDLCGVKYCADAGSDSTGTGESYASNNCRIITVLFLLLRTDYAGLCFGNCVSVPPGMPVDILCNSVQVVW